MKRYLIIKAVSASLIASLIIPVANPIEVKGEVTSEYDLSYFDACKLIVELKDKDLEIFDLDTRGALEVEENYSGSSSDLLTYASPEETKEAYYYYASLDQVEYVEVDGELYIDSYRSWGYSSLSDCETALNLDEFVAAKGSTFTNDIIVAVIDTGINQSHQVFANHKFVQGYDFRNNDSDPSDDNGHGTHCAGIIAEATGSYVSFMPIKIMDAAGRGNYSDLCKAVSYAVEAGADIISLSISNAGKGANAEVDSAINYAHENGVLVIAAAGNDSSDAAATTPANSPYSIAVGATDSQGILYSRSNWGNCVDFYAPGVAIEAASNLAPDAYAYRTGTSQASPHLVAVAAMLKAANPTYNYEDLVRILRESPARNNFSNGQITYNKNGQDLTGNRLMVGAQTEVTPGSRPKKVDISQAQLAIDTRDELYSGSPITKSITLSYGGVTLIEGQDYKVEYANNIDGGRASISVYGLGSFTGAVVSSFNIIQYQLPITVSLEKSSYPYTGKSIKAKVTAVLDSTGKAVDPAFYSISYKSNKSIGTASCVITMANDIYGSSTSKFKIIPQGIKSLKTKAKAKAVYLSWKPKSSNISGYQICYSTSKKFTSSKKITIKSKKTKSRTIKKLKARKTYYFKVRSYKTVGSGKNKKTYYSAWSSYKKVKTKK